ncbi:MAG: hypothetical protein KAH14_01635 [Clostridiales bacterium]|nr:hypothetical protein [Clostridiales bacterium]
MKNNRDGRKIKCIILSIIIFALCSCQTGDISSPSASSPVAIRPTPSPTESVKISTKQDDMAFNIYDKYPRASKSMEEFYSYLKDEYNIELQFHDLPLDWWESPETIMNINGIVRLDEKMYRDLVISDINPFMYLNEFININDTTKALPDILLESVVDKSGNVVGLYVGHEYILNVRVFNEEIFKTIDGEIPKSPEELLYLLKKSKPFYSGDDESPLKINTSHSDIPLYDLFESQGCRIYEGSYTIGWDRTTQSYEDSILSGDIRYVLDYTRQLVNEGLLTASPLYNTWDDYNDNKMFSANTRLLSSVTMPGELCFNLSNDKNVYVDNMYEDIYVIPANLKDGKAIFNDFINSFYGDRKLNIIGHYGVADNVKYSENYDNVTTVTNGLYSADGITALIPRMTGVWPNNPYSLYRDTYSEEIIEKVSNSSSIYYAYLNELINDKLLTLNFPLYQISTGERRGSSYNQPFQKKEINEQFRSDFIRFLEENIGTNDFINNYNIQMRKLNAEEYVDYLNERLGTYRYYSYN